MYSCLYNYSLQYYMLGCGVNVVHKFCDVVILRDEDAIKYGLFLSTK